jgi:hypothetical protein
MLRNWMEPLPDATPGLARRVSRGVTEQMGAIFEQRSKIAELAVIIRALSACFKVVARYIALGGTKAVWTTRGL